MGTPTDWERHAQAIGTFNAPAPAAATMPTPFASDDDFDLVMRRRRERSRQEQLEDELEEEAELRRLKRAERQAKMLRAEQQIAQLQNPQQSTNGMSEMVLTIMRDAAQDRKELLDELNKARNEASNNANAQMMEVLKTLQQRVENLSSPNGNGRDPIEQLVNQLHAVKEVRHALDEAAPPPPVVPPGQSRAQQLEEMRIQEEAELRRLEYQATLEDAKAKRESVVADREMKRHRVDRATEMVENVLAPIAAAVGSEQIGGKLSEKVGGLFGGGEKKAEASNGAPPVPAPTEPSAPAMMPWICPNDDCGATNNSPAGTTFDVCAHCKLGVTLTPNTGDGGAEDGFVHV